MKPRHDRKNYWQCPDCTAGIKRLPCGKGIICPTCLMDCCRPKAPRHDKTQGPLPDKQIIAQLDPNWKSKLAVQIENNVRERQAKR